MVETNKAKKHRISENWFDKYIQYPGIDIGSSNDPVDEKFDLWDFALGNGDATYMEGVKRSEEHTSELQVTSLSRMPSSA